MYYITLENAHIVVDGFPHKVFGPFKHMFEAKRWWAARDPGDWEGTINVICDPGDVPLPSA